MLVAMDKQNLGRSLYLVRDCKYQMYIKTLLYKMIAMKKLHGILAIIIFLFCQCSGPRDGGSTVDAGKIEDPKKLLKTADNLFSRGSY